MQSYILQWLESLDLLHFLNSIPFLKEKSHQRQAPALGSAGHPLASKCSAQVEGEPWAQMCVHMLRDTSWASVQAQPESSVPALLYLLYWSGKVAEITLVRSLRK